MAKWQSLNIDNEIGTFLFYALICAVESQLTAYKAAVKKL
jgi:hypothetical protein